MNIPLPIARFHVAHVKVGREHVGKDVATRFILFRGNVLHDDAGKQVAELDHLRLEAHAYTGSKAHGPDLFTRKGVRGDAHFYTWIDRGLARLWYRVEGACSPVELPAVPKARFPLRRARR